MYYEEFGARQCGCLCGYEQLAEPDWTGVCVLAVTTCGGGAECPKSAGIPRQAEAGLCGYVCVRNLLTES